MPESVVIPRRFNGPPDSANGGYTCGVLAKYVAGRDGGVGAAEVSLRRPPPLERALQVRWADGDGGDGDRDGAVLLDGEELVAEARAAEVDDPPHGPVPLAAASAAEEGFPFFRGHPFPTCFVCGPDRAPGDGMRIFAGPVADGEVFASSWTPDGSLGAPGAPLAPELAWAALDCPTCMPIANPPIPDGSQRPIVLARLAARLEAPIVVGRPHVITAWPIHVEGRKRDAGAAIWTEDGKLCATSRALWIELRD